MSNVVRVTSPSGPGGKDPNDMRDDPTFQSRLEEEVEKKKSPVLEKLKSLSATNRLKEMKKNLNNGVFVFNDIALAGQITLFYAKPNTGKTLFFLSFIINAVEERRITGEDVFYINADDNYDGLYSKASIANRFGFSMISPAEANQSPSEILDILEKMAVTEDISNKVIIMDTLKKFADMMNKRALADLFEVLRRLVTKGATVIIAGHANKHFDPNGNLVYEGTSDIMNDIDCAYSMYRMSDFDHEQQIVEFRREKDRGKNIAKVTYQYTKSTSTEYIDMVNSVTRLDDKHAKALSEEQYKSDIRQKYESEQLFIVDLLTKNGSMNQSEIIKEYKNQKAEGIASEISERGLRKALDELTYIDWTVRRDKESKNAKVFTLIEKPKPTFSTSPDSDKFKY